MNRNKNRLRMFSRRLNDFWILKIIIATFPEQKKMNSTEKFSPPFSFDLKIWAWIFDFNSIQKSNVCWTFYSQMLCIRNWHLKSRAKRENKKKIRKMIQKSIFSYRISSWKWIVINLWSERQIEKKEKTTKNKPKQNKRFPF